MIITYERASKQAGWKGDPNEDKIIIRGYQDEGRVSERDWSSELDIELVTFLDGDSTRIRVTLFGDSTSLLKSGRLVNGLRMVERAQNLDDVERALAEGGVSELVLLSDGGKPRIIENELALPSSRKKEGTALVLLGSVVLGNPTMIGANENTEAEAEELIRRANEMAAAIGFPEDTIKHIKHKAGEKPTGGGGTPPVPGGWMIGGTDTVH